jgi:polysaccharide pyruvyl transferase WcaK-like protein
MKNILILNNTEKYHNGCKSVINYFRNYFSMENLVVSKNTKPNIKKISLEKIDVVILNGEGTMHDDSENAIKFLEILKEAKIKGCKTMLVNSVWQNNSVETTHLLKYVDYISVREIKSKTEILKYVDKEIDINLDLSYYKNIDDLKYNNSHNIVAGNRFGLKSENRPKIQDIGEDGNIDIFTQGWDEIVSILKKSKLLVTGRHHEMYAACKANCPFIVLEGNTHKNSGLFETFGINLPVLKQDASSQEIINCIKIIDNYRDQFSLLFKKMKEHKIPHFPV